MTQEEFIEELKKRGYSYEIEGDEIVVTHQGWVSFPSLKSLPPGVQFQNQGWVSLDSLERVPPGVQFQNKGDVGLNSLESLPPGVQFQNKGDVGLHSLESLPPGVRFQNQGWVSLSSLVGGWFEDWKGNIEGVDPKRLLNLMIDKKLFL
jgi:hypothetical protein